MKELIQRLKEPTNTFWTRMRILMLIVLAVCVAIEPLADNLVAFGDSIPEWVLNWAKYGKVIAVTGTFLSSLTVKDKVASQVKAEVKEEVIEKVKEV